jgi:NAD(P)-dependent dehydrogenase (short-subunit alcohol dehydrogenase family)
MRALIVGTGGIGNSIAEALRARGDEVVTLSRRDDGLDITSEASVTNAIEGVGGTLDLVFVATGILMPDGAAPEKAIREVDPTALAQTFAVNAIGPMLILKHALPLMPKDRRAVFAALSARVGSIGDNAIGGWHAYRASKAGLNQLIHGAAIEMKRTHKQAVAVCLHPGTVETPFTENYKGHRKVTAPEAAANLITVIDGLTTEETGGFFDYAGRPIPW